MIRKIHGYTALILNTYTLMNALTSFAMLHSSWFPDARSEHTREQPSSVSLEATPRMSEAAVRKIKPSTPCRIS
ncbi:MAG: hypothetical protein IH951_12755 [Bacteroidetes bacterium]|nr:hypothetical protein [Bacteroidota bacterium]